ncbi:Dph6-related ATP pyrophosphatase [Dongshaea marina]|uniref:Dph6-related ATP pyrophosphatase n=1 Tax=Dongshaea marina TaxID=2047966 RepID=UPI000D3E3197|nr:diphthine--ammonia ligase [Dongshaea marina]
MLNHPTAANLSLENVQIHDQPCVVSWSGGKDSCLAMYRAIQSGAKIRMLLNMKIEDGERSRSHGLRSSVIEAQAKAMGVPLMGAATSWSDYENCFVAALSRLREQGITHGIFGDIDLIEHLEWEQMVCKKADMLPYLPLWQQDRLPLVREFVDAGFEARIVAVRADKLDKKYLGQLLTHQLLEEFAALGIDPCGENGEYHSVVTNGPLFEWPLELTVGEQVLRDGLWFQDFELED